MPMISGAVSNSEFIINSNIDQYTIMKCSSRLATIPSLIFIIFLFQGCDNDDPLPENQEELITTLSITLSPEGGGTIAHFLFYDPDGEGGIAPVTSADTLQSNTLYTAELTLLDESTAIPPDNITEEIRTEADEHQFFFVVTGADLIHTYADEDNLGFPLGLLNTFSSGTQSTGSMTVILRHEPDKAAPGVSLGLPELAGGETDIEVVFPVKID